MHLLMSVLVTVGVAVMSVDGHGYMQNPAARNCMWRFGFNNPKNYGDNENFCGGATVMARLGGKCGVCGDKYGGVQSHMDGGRYANNIIVKNYQPGQTVDIEVLLTTSHLGYFEFRIGDFSGGKVTAGDAIGKLQGQLMQVSTGGTQYRVTKAGRFLYKFSVKLPAGLTCERCVMQWWYRGGNNWGCGKNSAGKRACGLGYGPQEHFVNCADVSIGGTTRPVTKRPVTKRPVVTKRPITNRPATEAPTGSKTCTSKPPFQSSRMDTICQRKCNRTTGTCPSSLPCVCK